MTMPREPHALGRREFLTLVGAGVGAGAAALSVPGRLFAQAAAPRRPNIIVILADDLGYAGVGVQGCTDIPTPNIDAIAQNGVRLTNGYVSCPVCSPTRAGLMTGRYQQRFGHELNPGPPQSAHPNFGLLSTETILPERLKAFGYATGMFGKWHLGYSEGSTPTKRGFDEFYGFLGGAHSYIPGQVDTANPIMRGTEPVEAPEYLTDALAAEACSFIERRAAGPFLLYLPFNAVHNPAQATDKYLQRFAGIADEKRRTHAAMLSALDDAVGAVIGKLRDLSLEEDTLLFFISDNGGPTPSTTSSNVPLRGYKGQTWEGGFRVPFMVQWKGHLPAGKLYDQPAIALDILPTAVAAAGKTAEADWKLDGVDLLPFLSGERTEAPHENLYWRFGEQWAIRRGDWKLVVAQGLTTPALYNLAQDIGETTDLAATEAAKVTELQQAYDDWNAQLIPPRWKRQTAGAATQRFRQLDADGDGKLSAQELGRQRLFQRLDANGDGSLSPEEAGNALRGRRAQ
jgi:arylsulfatase A-like enzyme